MELDSKLVVLNKKKCGRRRSKGVDRISELPDYILVHVLSLLPLEGAAATSVLSRRWSHLWRYTPNLTFRNHRFRDPMVNIPTTCMMNELNDVDPHFMRTLKNIEWSHKALSLKQFAISFYIHKDIPHQAQVLTEWIHFALSLDLQFSRCILDTSSFTGLCTNSDYKFLKELRLKNLKVNVEVVELFLHSCSVTGTTYPLCCSVEIRSHG